MTVEYFIEFPGNNLKYVVGVKLDDMALDLQLKVINNVKGKADRFCRLIFRGNFIKLLGLCFVLFGFTRSVQQNKLNVLLMFQKYLYLCIL